MHATIKSGFRVGVLAAIVLSTTNAALQAADPENCLMCHRYRGLARINPADDMVHLYQVDPDYYDRALGPHARLKCTDCHEKSEVGVIPHKPTSLVDCTRTCHLQMPGNVEVRFSHDGIVEMLEDSVHNIDTLKRVNVLLGEPVAEGQAQCLLCHDEPSFRRQGETWLEHAAPISRCNVCHDDSLPRDTDFGYWHVHARSRPARSHLNVARACGMCHADPDVRAAFDLPEVLASYTASFHGKAVLLGSEDTATCLDCHVGELANIHMIHPKDDERSSIHEAHVTETCRSPACHPTAGHAISQAAVHLDLTTSSGIEFIIAAAFVVLIFCTFGPSVVLAILEMVQVVVARGEPEVYERKKLVDKAMKTVEGRVALHRFTGHQRVQHWFLVITFTLLVLTGFPIRFADRAWAHFLIEFFHGLPVVRVLHRYAGAALLAGLVYHLVYVAYTTWERKRRTGNSWFVTIRDLPMMTNWTEIKELGQLMAYMFGFRKERPPGHRFTFHQKFEYFGVFWGTVILGVTGVLMWANAWTTEHLPGRVLTIVFIIHGFEAVLALLHVGVVHLVSVIFSPAVFPMSKAMFWGDTPTFELAEVHSEWVEDRLGLREGPSSEGGADDD